VSYPTCLAVWLFAAVAVCGAGWAGPATAAAQDGTRTVFVSVTGKRGGAVPDLSTADLVVREDGKAREIIALRPATEPLHIALLIDDNGYGLGFIRQGVLDFVNGLRGRAEFAITTTSGRNIRLLDYTSDMQLLFPAINKLFARNQKGSYLLDGLMEAADDMTRRELTRGVILAVTTEGEEFSSTRTEPILEAIRRSRAQVYLLNLGAPAMGTMNPASALRGESLLDESNRRNVVLGAAPARSGGRVEQVVANSGIPMLMQQIATELACQYAVTYRTAGPGGKLTVDVKRMGIKARAPQSTVE
jgi:VWFA-related protein